MTIDETRSGIAITERVGSANKLLEWLTPHTSRLYGDFLDTDDDGRAAAWIFRGQSNSEWKLLPSAHRSKDAFDDFLHHRGSVHRTLADRRRLELELVKSFLRQADRHGFHIPDEDPLLRDPRLDETAAAREINAPEFSAFPPSGLLATFALAQHHGIPTRLLDWTWKPLVAAYFAAQGAAPRRSSERENAIKSILTKLRLRERDEPGTLERIGLSADESNLVVADGTVKDRRLSVFALRASALRLVDEYALDLRIHLITSATALNANLRAQGGLFTLLQPRNADIELPDLHTYLIEVDKRIPPDAPVRNKFPLLVELTMPVREVGAPHARILLGKLVDLGISAATVEPGLRGVVDSIKEFHQRS